MPIYEYHCNKCDKNFEELVLSQSEKICCPNCKSSKVERLLSGFSFKCSGNFSGTGGSSCSGCSSTNCSSCN